MKLEDVYKLVVQKGLEKDPRSKKELREELSKVNREYRAMKPEDKRFFDKERTRHPFADTRILYGDGKRRVRTIIAGIDIGGEELLTALFLNKRGAGIDLAMSHHPSGKALSALHNVMHVQTSILNRLGVDAEVAKSLMGERIEEVSRRVSARNHERYVDIARLLDIPLISVHTPADNHVAWFLQRLFNRKKPKKVSDVLKILKTIPEYQDAMRKNAGPHLLIGKEKARAGRIFVDMTGGTEGSKKIFGRLSQAGVGTIVAMHLSEEHFKMAKAEFINVIVAGHIASDNLGLNLVLDELARKFDFDIVQCSGFVRFKR